MMMMTLDSSVLFAGLLAFMTHSLGDLLVSGVTARNSLSRHLRAFYSSRKCRALCLLPLSIVMSYSDYILLDAREGHHLSTESAKSSQQLLRLLTFSHRSLLTPCVRRDRPEGPGMKLPYVEERYSLAEVLACGSLCSLGRWTGFHEQMSVVCCLQ